MLINHVVSIAHYKIEWQFIQKQRRDINRLLRRSTNQFRQPIKAFL